MNLTGYNRMRKMRKVKMMKKNEDNEGEVNDEDAKSWVMCI